MDYFNRKNLIKNNIIKNKRKQTLASLMDNSTNYQVTINFGEGTAESLNAQKYSLYAFKAVQGTPGGQPVLWFSYPPAGGKFMPTIIISWKVAYSAYISTSVELNSGVEVMASSTTPANLGDIINVMDESGTLTPKKGGPGTAISVSNQTATPYNCGLSQAANNGPSQILCAFPLNGKHIETITPVEKVALMFSNTPQDLGTVIIQSFSSGVLIDLTEAPDQTRTVSYDINKGWDYGQSEWGTDINENDVLAHYLISDSEARTTHHKHPHKKHDHDHKNHHCKLHYYFN